MIVIEDWRLNLNSLIYDPVGNRARKVENDLTTSYAYDVANQLLSQETRDTSNTVVSQGTMQYDPNGCLLYQVQDGQTTSYAWNAQSFLIQTIFPNSERETYTYCGEGIRRKTQSNAGIRLFIRDGKNILLEARSDNSTIRRYTHRSDHWGTLLSVREGGASHFYGFDGNANTRLLTDQNAGVSDSYLYSAFGEELLVTGNSANPLRFGGEVGYYRDTAKRTYVRARHLDAAAGRWLSRDPIGIRGGDRNLYRYVGNNPVNSVDPEGLIVFAGNYGNCCGPFKRCNSTSVVIDEVDAACRRHDVCLAGIRELLNPFRVGYCDQKLALEAMRANCRKSPNSSACRTAALQIAVFVASGGMGHFVGSIPPLFICYSDEVTLNRGAITV